MVKITDAYAGLKKPYDDVCRILKELQELGNEEMNNYLADYSIMEAKEHVGTIVESAADLIKKGRALKAFVRGA